MKGRSGFTLLEVLIATSIAAVGIVGLLELFSGSSHLARASIKQTRALLLARSLMDSALWRADLERGESRDANDEFRWQVKIEPYEPRLGAPDNAESRENVSDSYELKRVRVRVEWGDPGQAHRVSLSSVRIMELF